MGVDNGQVDTAKLEPGHPLKVWAILLVIVAAHITLAALAFDPKPFVGGETGGYLGDNAGYMILAESLESGRGYRDLHLPGTPHHIDYPPFYPAVLALAGAAGGELTSYKVLSALFSTASVLLLFLLAGTRLSSGDALAVTAAFALNPVGIYFSHWVLTEALLVLLLVGGLWAATRSSKSSRWFIAALLLGCAAYLTRPLGLSLLLALCIALAWRRQWQRAGLTAGTALVLVVGWWLRKWIVTGKPLDLGARSFFTLYPGVPELGKAGPGELLARVVNNTRRYAVDVMPETLMGSSTAQVIILIALLASLLILALAAVAWLRDMRRPSVPALLTAAYVLAVLLVPEIWLDRRLLLPILPMVFLYAAEGLVWCFEFVRYQRPRWAVPLAAVVLVLVALPHQARAVKFGRACSESYAAGDRLACYPPPWRAYAQAGEWVRQNTPADAIIVSPEARLFYLFSGRRGMVFPRSSNDEEMLAFLDSARADFVVAAGVRESTYRYLLPVMRSVPERFVLARRIGDPEPLAYVASYRQSGQPESRPPNASGRGQ
jgi:hypothetical protein